MAIRKPEYLGTSTVARRLGVSQNYVRILIKQGRLPAVSTEIGFVVSSEALEQFAQERSNSQGSGGAGPRRKA